LSNIVEKAMGSIAKSGHAPICEVVGPGQIPSKGGLVFAATPASDIVCGPTQLASGITLQVFSTGRGTPYSLREAPVIKIATRHELLERWPDLFDVDAGFIITGEKTIPEVGMELYDMILDVASGRESEAEKLGLYNDLIIDNPAPIT
jgi:galactarate dehydratase